MNQSSAGGVSASAEVVVEFLGLPGSGKSTLTRETVRQLRSAGATVHETYEFWNAGRSSRLADVAGSLLTAARRRPRLFLDGWRLAGPLAGGATMDRAKTAAHWISRCGHYEGARHIQGLHLIDQGVLQVYWSLAYAGHTKHVEEVWRRLEATRPHADAVVIVRAKPETVLARLVAREGTTSRLERSLDDPETALARAEGALAWVCERLESVKRRQLLLEVDNDASSGATDAAAQVAVSLLERFGGRRGL